MTENREQIERLQRQLDRLVRTQIDFQKDVIFIRAELDRLRSAKAEPVSSPTGTESRAEPSQKPPVDKIPKTAPPPFTHAAEPASTLGYADRRTSEFSAKLDSIADSARGNFEKFVGENLLSKVGIIILVLGVAIGAKYAIDQGWISPTVRIVFGYVCGFALAGFAVRLKQKYPGFSAVLLSGGVAIMYFITYFGYALYQLFSQTTAFVLMFMFTAFAVAAAIMYSRQIIAHLGLVGAYAVPFLLSDNSGNYPFLFTYIAIVNVGILAVSLNRYWKPLFYTSFVVTWATFYFWWLDKFVDAEHFTLALTFAAIFYLIFYITFVGHKFRSGQNVAIENISLVLANSFIFYGLGYVLLDRHARTEGYLGLFTIGNAVIHLSFGLVASRIKTVSTDFIYLLGALVLTFATISIPVQYDGHTVTLAWTAEAALLFWIGRTKAIELYEHFSYPLIAIASISLIFDFAVHLDRFERVLAEASRFPFFNGFFITSLFYVAAFSFIYYINRDGRYAPAWSEDLRELIKYAVATMAAVVLYNAFRVQINDYFDFLRLKTAVGVSTPNYGTRADVMDGDLGSFSVLWQVNYTMLFLSAVAVLNIRRFRSGPLAVVNMGLNVMTLFAFLSVGLFLLSELRESYLLQTSAEYFPRGIFHIAIRYVSYAFVAGLFVSIYQYLNQPFIAEDLPTQTRRFLFELLLNLSLLIILSSELLNVMDLTGQKGSYKLGLSIFWGIYSLALVGLGIYFGRRHLRISAIILFGITLVKLFLYDIADLDTVSKTIVFVSLGALMLIVSFLYHKYKAVIFKADEATDE